MPVRGWESVIAWKCLPVSVLFPDAADAEKMAQYAQEERNIREENLRLQRRLQLEMERRENLCRHLSESESSLEMDDERSVAIACQGLVELCWGQGDNYINNQEQWLRGRQQKF